VNGEPTAEVPYQMLKARIEPVYTALPGWKTDITGIKQYSDVPEKMKQYIDYIRKYLGVEISYVSNGPGRDQIISV
jgi:adenylosuccinate synthase